MKTVSTRIKNIFIAITVSLQIAAFPAMVFAQESSGGATASKETTASSEEQKTGPTKPTGADSKTFKYNESTGNWENDYFTWNPTTHQTSPKTPLTYSYNPSTGMWDTTEYVYHPESNKYEPNVKSISNTGAGSTQSIAAPSNAGGSNSISNTGPNSNNSIKNNNSSNGTFDLFFNGSISSSLNSSATSGNANIQGNTKAGSALTGDASSLANVINMLQSSWLDQGSDVAGFIANVDGNVYGDLFVDPSAIPYGAGISKGKVDLNVSANSAINNDINLAATSGNANVSENTEAGSAKTGDATAVANLMNMINSSISSGKSFLGVLNINGNLNGDILLPQSLLDSIIASTGPNSNNQIKSVQKDNLDVSVDTNRTILNNVAANADSGDANISQNTQAGSAKTGKSETNTKTMNLVGQNYDGKNGILVFINVLGKWVGLSISPLGSSSITNTGPNSNNVITSDGDRSVSVKADENSLINNNVNVKAKSGDANVSNNTKAGDATTGNAYAAVNILNMIDSKINVEDWFGVLFINVFGSWEGSFGLNTAAGNNRATASSAGGSSGTGNNNKVFNFVPKNVNNAYSNGNSTVGGAAFTSGNGGPGSSAAILASASQNTGGAKSTNGNTVANASAASNVSKSTPAWQKNLFLSTITALLAAAVLFGDRVANFARTRFASFL